MDELFFTLASLAGSYQGVYLVIAIAGLIAFAVSVILPSRPLHPILSLLFVFVSLLILRLPIITLPPSNPDEAFIVSGAITWTYDPIYWRSVDSHTHGPGVALGVRTDLFAVYRESLATSLTQGQDLLATTTTDALGNAVDSQSGAPVVLINPFLGLSDTLPPERRCHDFAGSRPHGRTLRGTDRRPFMRQQSIKRDNPPTILPAPESGD